MSSDDIYQCSPAQPIETVLNSQKRSRVSYTRDFLLSLSELDVCKTLPTGCDQSILSEFEETSHSIPEWQRIPGSLSSQSFRRGEYGSSPPTRGDSGNYSRGSHGRWDSRSSGSIDKDSDTQSDCSDSGRRYGNQSRHSWQNSEHDGLLGSGAFLKPPGYTAGVSAPKVRGNGHYQPSRSNEPYHPPRPYKAAPHSRRELTDLHNDETFGSTECSSQDREEEERKRRASFELMRKEQHKTFQERQKHVSDKQKGIFDTDITAWLEGSEDEKKLPNKDNVSEASVVPLVSENDSPRFSFPTQTSASRPLVPPGFAGTILETNIGSKTLIPSPVAEVGNVGFGDSIKHAEDNLVANGTFDNLDEKHVDSTEQHYEAKSVRAPLVDDNERIVFPSSSAEVSDDSAGVDSLCKSSKLSEACEGQHYGETTIDTGKVTGHKIVNTDGQDHSTSILEKLFSSALTANTVGSSSFIEHHDHDIKDDSWSSAPFQSSKFAQWFLEEEKKPVDDLSCSKPSDLLSLIVTSDRGGSQASGVSDEKAMEHIPPIVPFESNELANMLIASTPTSKPVGNSEPMYHHNKSVTTQGVLTCEDLEQSILQEINEKSSSLEHSVQHWSLTNSKAKQPKADVDNCASQHLLSLLQKGTSIKDPSPFSNLDVSPDKSHVYGVGSLGPLIHRSSEGNTQNIQNSEKTLTLETLFGTAFMKELYSVEAPVSVQIGSTGGARKTDASEPHGLSFPVSDDGLFSTVGEFGLSKSSPEGNYLTSKVKPEKIEGHWLGFDDPKIDLGSKFGAAGGFEDRADGTMEIKLPEEDSLITVADSVNPQNTTFMPAFNAMKDDLLSPSNTPVDIAEKLAALNATTLKDERSKMPGLEGPPFLRGPYDQMDSEILYSNLHGQPSSPQFHHSPMNHGRPFFHSLDAHHAHMNSSIKYMGPENIIHHDPPPHHHFHANMFRHPPFQQVSAAPTRFDPPHHSMLPHMHMPNSFPPPHLIQGLPRGSPLPPHAFNQMAGYMPEMNQMQGFPVNHRQLNYSGAGIPMPETNHPEALERLIEMELRANSKQMHPVAAPGRNMGMYGHELDMGFRYR